MNPAEIEELKGSLKQIDDKFDRLIQRVEECAKLQDTIHQRVKAIVWGVEEQLKSEQKKD